MFDQIIIGGGVIGLLTAYELLQAGQRVALVERGELGRESSWAGGGILSPLYPWRFAPAVNNLADWSRRTYPALVRRLSEETGIDPQWIQSGMLVLDADPGAVAAWAGRYGRPYHWSGVAETRELEPNLAAATEQALWLPDIAQIRNPRLLKALRMAVSQRGLEIYENQTVSGFIQDQDRLRGVTTDAGEIAAETVIVCSGAWSGELLRQWDGLEVEPVKGQMLMFGAEPGLVQHMVLNRGHYVIPRQDGRVLAGSTLEHTGFDKSTTQEGREALYEAATGLFPDLAAYPVERHWAGLRPGSRDGIPYICPHPRVRGLYINAGHYRNGVVLAPGSARLMADIVLGRDPILNAQEYALDRRIMSDR